MKTCKRPGCENIIPLRTPRKNYCCDQCKTLVQEQREAERKARHVAERQRLREAEAQRLREQPEPEPVPAPPPQRRPRGYRATSLAMAGETRDTHALYRDCLTGGASATVHRSGPQAIGGRA